MKNLKNLGKALTKAEQKETTGGKPLMDPQCYGDDCDQLCYYGGVCLKGICHCF